MLMFLLGCESCLARHEEASVETHAYPTCDGQPLPEGEVLAEGVLRTGPTYSQGTPVVERYSLRRRGCVYAITIRQEWARQVTDVEALFDEQWRPIRAWKRMGIPGVPEPEQYEDIRLYELRNEPATMTERNADTADVNGGVIHRSFRGGQPTALVGPGRFLLTAWIRAADLEVGETDRGKALDFRELFEKVDDVALRRDADRFEETLGRNVRVYTFFGRESVFTDDDNLVIGDLAGLRRDEDLEGAAPEPLPSASPPDPVGTP